MDAIERVRVNVEFKQLNLYITMVVNYTASIIMMGQQPVHIYLL